MHKKSNFILLIVIALSIVLVPLKTWARVSSFYIEELEITVPVESDALFIYEDGWYEPEGMNLPEEVLQELYDGYKDLGVSVSIYSVDQKCDISVEGSIVDTSYNIRFAEFDYNTFGGVLDIEENLQQLYDKEYGPGAVEVLQSEVLEFNEKQWFCFDEKMNGYNILHYMTYDLENRAINIRFFFTESITTSNENYCNNFIDKVELDNVDPSIELRDLSALTYEDLYGFIGADDIAKEAGLIDDEQEEVTATPTPTSTPTPTPTKAITTDYSNSNNYSYSDTQAAVKYATGKALGKVLFWAILIGVGTIIKKLISAEKRSGSTYKPSPSYNNEQSSSYNQRNISQVENKTKNTMDDCETIKEVYANVYVPGGPVLLKSSIIVKDTTNGKIYIENQIKNISDVPIAAIKLDIVGIDPFENVTDKLPDYIYKDIDLKPGCRCGKDVLVCLGSGNARNAQILLKSVSFADGTKWDNDDRTWEINPNKKVFVFSEYENDLKALKNCREIYNFLVSLDIDDDNYVNVCEEIKRNVEVERMYGNMKDRTIDYIQKKLG